jgi:cytochrome c553
MQISATSVTQDDFDSAIHAVANIQHGEALFVGCTGCHATDGGGSDVGDVPAIAGQFQIVLLRQLVDFRHAQRWDVRMQGIAASHLLPKPQDIADVAAFVAAMPAQSTIDHGDGMTVTRGRSVYVEQCAGCHGPMADGSNAKHVPRLAAQSYHYLLRQMYDTVDRRRPNLTGLHSALFSRFDRDDFVAVADYLSRLTP